MFTKQDIEKSIGNLTTKSRVYKELALESFSEDQRKIYEKDLAECLKRLKELEAMLNEVPESL